MRRSSNWKIYRERHTSVNTICFVDWLLPSVCCLCSFPTKVFEELFGVPKADFAKMPKWKKDNAKKKHGLF